MINDPTLCLFTAVRGCLINSKIFVIVCCTDLFCVFVCSIMAMSIRV